MNLRNARMKWLLGVLGMGLMGATAAGCTAETPRDEIEQSAAAERPLVSGKATVSFSCPEWNATCRRSLERKLVAARARSPQDALASVDTLARSPGFVNAQAVETPDTGEVWCGTAFDVTVCCWFTSSSIGCNVVTPLR